MPQTKRPLYGSEPLFPVGPTLSQNEIEEQICRCIEDFDRNIESPPLVPCCDQCRHCNQNIKKHWHKIHEEHCPSKKFLPDLRGEAAVPSGIFKDISEDDDGTVDPLDQMLVTNMGASPSYLPVNDPDADSDD